jgi:large subunit ribosomal protein L13
MKTYSPKPEHIERRWYVIDASGKVLGRVASEAAALLRGKHKPIFAPHMDVGDHVIIVNADKVELTGGKELKKFAYRHSGYPGGITATRYDDLMRNRPVFAVEKAIRGMLPKNRLGRSMIRKLHVVPGPEHPHAAQQPEAYTLGQPPMWQGLPAPRAPKAAVPTPKTPTAPKAHRASAKTPSADPDVSASADTTNDIEE